MRRTLLTIPLLALAVAACGDAAKTATSKAPAVAPSSKEGPSQAVLAAELATAFAANDGSKGINSIGAGQTVQETLSSADDQLGDGSYYDAWVFRLFEDAAIQASMTSSEVDSYLSLYAGEPGAMGSMIASDDDGGGIPDALLGAELTAGTYTLLANSYAGGETGAYSLTLAVAGGGEGGNEPSGSTLRAGSTVSGTLEAGDATLDDGSHYDTWVYHGTAGDRLTVTMTSGEVDSFLLLFLGGMETGEYIAEDDDGAGMPNARLSVTLPASGTYTVVANTYGAGETGGYQLQVESAAGQGAMTFDNSGPSDGRYALLVGIDDYPGQGSDLRGPVRDAEIIRDVLVERYGFDQEKVVMLTDAQATRENIANGIVQHLGQAGPDGVAVFFYSGHGTQVGANIGLTGALDPEPRGDGDEALYIYGYTDESSLLVDEELGYLMETLEAGRALVLVDACFSGEITRGPGDAPQSKRVDLTDPEVAESLRLPTNFIAAEPKVAGELTDMSIGFGELSSFAQVFSQPQRHVMWGSSTEEQVSWTSGLGGGASVFTYYLGEHLANAPLTSTLSQVHELVARDVVGYIEQDGNMTMQNPQMRGDNASMTLEEFFRQR